MFFVLITSTIPTVSAQQIPDAIMNLLDYDVQPGEISLMWLGNHQKGSLEGHASAGFLLKTSNYPNASGIL